MTFRLDGLPHSEALERRVIGSMLLDLDTFRQVVDSLHPDDFYSSVRGQLFDLLRQQQKPDPFLIVESLRSHFGAHHATAWDEWQLCTAAWCGIDGLDDHCARIRQLAQSRRVATTCAKIAAEAINQLDNPGDYLDSAELAFSKAISQRDDLAGDETMSDGMVETIERIAAVKPFSGAGRSIGIKDLDALVGGFQPGALYVIAGRPSMGKSAFATQIALSCALDGYLQMTSLEMSPHSIRVRLLSSATGIDSRMIERNTMSTTQWSEVQDAASALAELRFGWTRGVRTLENLKRTSRAAARRHKKVGGVLVDYMQLLRSEERFGSRELEIAHISRELKLLAEELECPVLAVSQLNRAAEQRAENRPLMSDLRESGAIEQDADCVLLLYRDEYYNENTQEPGTCEINVAKNRGGMTGTCKVRFERTCTRFRPLLSVVGSPRSYGGS